MNSYPKIAVMISGNGSNLQSIIDHIQKGSLRARLCVVISDNAQAFGLERAKIAGVPTEVVGWEKGTPRSDFDRAMVKALETYHVKWIVLAGFMRLLGPDFIHRYEGHILNIHPSLLPQYPGLCSIQKAFEAKEQYCGVTVHRVDLGIDTGPIILQEKVPILPNDSLETLTERVHRTEHQIYPKAIEKVLWEHVT